ncbi:hypothetical protein [Spirochaeta isovalerica]|uniref:PAS domain-containing protein n=1 Tax=Spirochaeta isovalerica TaxID=150 RepID=A0A841RC62_9SPIO|nr:hypothetical protein [Spirochaeta isovalerica]MBB6479992.1 hypothetical protein [Spirochaeta isovalerica]
MKIECAWCGKSMGEKALHVEGTSHSMCEDCASDLLSRPIGSIRDYLDRLEYPVLLIDSETNMKAENTRLKELTGKEPELIEGYKGGDVFNCIHHSKPGGCGKTIHCKVCTIRNAVEETFNTGNPCIDVKATLKVYVEDAEQHVSSFITTHKVGDFVLLAIKDLRVDEKS